MLMSVQYTLHHLAMAPTTLSILLARIVIQTECESTMDHSSIDALRDEHLLQFQLSSLLEKPMTWGFVSNITSYDHIISPTVGKPTG
jgi:hypothetical protein